MNISFGLSFPRSQYSGPQSSGNRITCSYKGIQYLQAQCPCRSRKEKQINFVVTFQKVYSAKAPNF